MYKIRLISIIFSVILLFSLASCSGYAGDTSLGSQDQQVSQTAENVSVLSEEKDEKIFNKYFKEFIKNSCNSSFYLFFQTLKNSVFFWLVKNLNY